MGGQQLWETAGSLLPQVPDQRISYLLCIFLLRDTWVTVDDLCARLYVSRGTVTADLKHVERVVGAYGLELTRRPYHGMRVSGPERLRRLCLARLVDHADQSQGAMKSLFYCAVDAVLGTGQEALGDKRAALAAKVPAAGERDASDLTGAMRGREGLPGAGVSAEGAMPDAAEVGSPVFVEIARCLDAALAQGGMRVYADARRPLAVRTTIALVRVRLGSCLEGKDADADGNAPEAPVADAAPQTAHAPSGETVGAPPDPAAPAGVPIRAAVLAARNFERSLGVALPPAEVDALAAFLVGAQLAEDVRCGDVPADASALAHAMLDAAWRAFRFDFHGNADLADRLARHVGPLLPRRRCGMDLGSPLAADMPTRFPLAWAFAQVAASVLEQPAFAAYAPPEVCRRGPLPAGELAQLALLFAMALERQRAEAPRRNVAVVSALGAAEAGLVAQALRRSFGAYVGTVTVCSPLDAPALDCADIDFAFATASAVGTLPMPTLDAAAVLDQARADEVRAFLRGDAQSAGSAAKVLGACLLVCPLAESGAAAAWRALAAQGTEVGVLAAHVVSPQEPAGTAAPEDPEGQAAATAKGHAVPDADVCKAPPQGRATPAVARIGAHALLACTGPGPDAALALGVLDRPLAVDKDGSGAQVLALLQSPARSTHAFRALLARLCRLLADDRAVAGRRVSYRALAAVATLTVGVVGSLPFFCDDFLFVLGTRAVAGFAQGVLSTLYNGTVALSVFPLDRATRVQGAGSIVGNLAGIFYQVSSAALAAVSIRYIWLIHAFLLVPFALDVLFMPRAPLSADAGEKGAAAACGSAGARTRSPLPLIAVGVAVVYAAFLLFMGPVNLVVSNVISGEGLGTSGDIAMICTLYTVGGMLGGVAFDRFYHLSGRWFFLCSLGLLALGIGSAAFTHSVAGYAFGAACCGFALFLFQPGSMAFLSTEVGPAALAGVSGFFMAAGSLASFANTPYMMLVATATGNDNPRYPLMVGCVAVALIAVAWGLAMARRGTHRQSAAVSA